MEEKWTKEIRRKLEGHRKSPPEGLWEGISEQMGLKPEGVSHPAQKRRWYWAAAAVLLLGVGFAVYQNNSNEPSSLTVSNIQKQEEKPKTEKMDALETPPSSSDQIVLPTATSSSDLAVIHVNKKNQVKHHENVRESEETAVKEANGKENERIETEEYQPNVKDQPLPEANNLEAEEVAVTKEEKPLMSKEEKQINETLGDINDYPTPSFAQVQHHSSEKGKWTMGIQTSSGLLAANNSTGLVKNYYYVNDKTYANNKSMPHGDDEATEVAYIEYETYHSKHRPPVRLGMSLHYQLNDHVSLLSGINYTWLYSEFVKKSSTIDQHLHYLGIPIGVAYRLWSNRHVQCYLSGEVMLEKCLNKKPWQWSVDAGAGAEYTLTPQVGLYLEPSLGYNFNDGTSYEHYFKDHPLAPSIMFGLRLHIE